MGSERSGGGRVELGHQLPSGQKQCRLVARRLRRGLEEARRAIIGVDVPPLVGPDFEGQEHIGGCDRIDRLRRIHGRCGVGGGGGSGPCVRIRGASGRRRGGRIGCRQIGHAGQYLHPAHVDGGQLGAHLGGRAWLFRMKGRSRRARSGSVFFLRLSLGNDALHFRIECVAARQGRAGDEQHEDEGVAHQTGTAPFVSDVSRTSPSVSISAALSASIAA
jgi:hypothetical protein